MMACGLYPNIKTKYQLPSITAAMASTNKMNPKDSFYCHTTARFIQLATSISLQRRSHNSSVVQENCIQKRLTGAWASHWRRLQTFSIMSKEVFSTMLMACSGLETF
jgi:hypothetical protein